METGPSDPSTPNYTNSLDWITAYLTVHSMSKASYRVTYALWIIIATFFIIGTIIHLAGTDRPWYFAHWSKWALRRRTWRKNRGKKGVEESGKPHRQPTPLPPNSQLLSLAFIFVLTMILAFAGPDYIYPSTKTSASISDPVPSPSDNQQREVDREEVQQYVARYTIQKAWWTVAGRTGLMAFALFPLCILFALKAAPFALFALPYTTQLSFDKLSTMHRWVARLIWFFTLIHVISWCVQFATHDDPVTGKIAFTNALIYPPFYWGTAAFILLTLLIITSLRPFRYNFYETFYVLHILLVPATLITAAIHHPSVGWWTYSALIIWLAERLWRRAWWLYVNGIFAQKAPNASPQDRSLGGVDSGSPPVRSNAEYHEDDDIPLIKKQSRAPSKVEALLSSTSTYIPPPGYAHAELMPGKTIRLAVLTPDRRSWAPGQHFILCIPSINKFTSHPFTAGSVCDQQSSNPAGRLLIFFIRAKAGWTKKLWDTVVALSVRDKFHCDGDAPPQGTHPPSRGVLFRIFVDGPFGSVARTDWIEYSSVLLVAGGSGVSFTLSVLVYLCLCMSGRDSRYLGGTSKPFSVVSKVRFVWLAREFSHIHWCASVLKRCMALVPGSLQVDIFVTNIPKDPKPMPPAGIENQEWDSKHRSKLRGSPTPEKRHITLQLPPPLRSSTSMEEIPLVPYSDPSHTPPLEEKSRWARTRGPINDDHNSLLIPDPHIGLSGEQYGDGGLRGDDHDYEMGVGSSDRHHVLDYTHFDGDLDTEVPGEESLSRILKQQGTARRKKTRKATMGYVSRSNSTPSMESWVTTQELVASPVGDTNPLPLPLPHDFGADEGRGPTMVSSTNSFEEIPTETIARHISFASHLQPGELGLRNPSMPRDETGDRASIRGSIMDVSAVQSLMPKIGTGARGEEIKLRFSDEEMEDVLAMTEYAWPGRPMLDKLLQDEVEAARGAVVVACCGPTSLSASIRKIVAAQIDPQKIKRGDMTGYISCVTEEFEY